MLHSPTSAVAPSPRVSHLAWVAAAAVAVAVAAAMRRSPPAPRLLIELLLLLVQEMADFLTRDNKQLREQIFEFLKVSELVAGWGGAVWAPRGDPCSRRCRCRRAHPPARPHSATLYCLQQQS